MGSLAVYATVLLAAQAVPLRIGDTVVLELRGDPARAERAAAALAEAIDDPECDADGLVVLREEAGTSLSICGARFLDVTAEDASWEGRTVDETAERWSARLRERFVAEKSARYSSALLRRALTGLVYPLLLIAAIVLARLGFRRWRQRLLSPPGGARGLRLGPLHLLATPGERRFLAALVSAAATLVYLVLGYAFVVALFREIPQTRGWARAMLEPLGEGLRQAGTGLLLLVPRLLLLVLLLVVLRLVLRSLTRLFDQVRRGEFRAEPFLTPDTVGTAELAARLLLVALSIFLATLLLPGGRILQLGFLLVGLALAVGAYPLAANVLAGLVTVYGRPLHRGDRVSIAGRVGTVVRKGFLHLVVAEDGGGSRLVPNRAVLDEGFSLLGPERRLAGEIVVRSARGVDAAVGLIRHAAVEAGLRRDCGQVDLHAVREGRLVFRFGWPLDGDSPPEEIRARFLRALLEHGPGLEVDLVSAFAPAPPAP